MNYQESNQNLVELKQQLLVTEQAHQLAVQMSRFKAGFLARIAHEVRTPVTRAMSLNQIILSDLCDNPEEQKDFIARSQKALQELMQIIDQVIAVAAQEDCPTSLEMIPFSLSQFLRGLEEQIHLQVENRSLQLEIVPPNPDVQIYADYCRLFQGMVLLIDAVVSQSQLGKIALTVDSDKDSVTLQLSLPISLHLTQEIGKANTSLKENQGQISPQLLPELRLWLLHSLLNSMGGFLEVQTKSNTEPKRDFTHLLCVIPKATTEDLVASDSREP